MAETINDKPLHKRKKIRQTILLINSLRQKEIDEIENNIVKALRDSIKFGKKTLSGEKTIDEYVNFNEQIEIYIRELFEGKKLKFVFES